MIIMRICFYFLLFATYGNAQQLYTTPESPLKYQDKKRITEILRRDNYGLVEPFFYVSNRPTIQQALADEIKYRTLVSPMNHMVYCPTGRDYFTNDSLSTGAVYIGAENLPKNGNETNLWFHEAYKYRNDSDPIRKPANVAIISATRQNFLRVQCPNTHNNIIVSQAPSPAPIEQIRPQLNIDTVKNLRYGDQPEVDWNLNNYTIPSTIKAGYIKSEALTRGSLKKRELNAPEKYINMARIASNKHGIFIKFLLAIAQVSSEYDQNKIAEEGTKLGVMQIHFNIARYYKINREDFFDPQKAFDIAGLYLKDLSKRYNGNINNILQAYSLGLEPDNIDPDIADIPVARNFSSDVMRYIDTDQPVIF